ncbi:MAG: FadR/GntR family transcriptional regulator [Clostridia bacterium]|jgi:GntR family transcriptional repressor for pyruvate dehydrogenase complex|nr:FadR/GntR family transcriptional regulator [Clostridia bacterium]
MELNFKQIKKSTLSDSIIKQIFEMISQGNIAPGQKLPSERDLAEALTVSRPSIREAMRSLRTMGLIDVRMGDGMYLKEDMEKLSDFRIKNLLKKYSILELTEARKLLEVEICTLAAERATEEHRELIRSAFYDTLRFKNDPEAFLKADFEYHMTIAEAAQNKYLAEMLYTTRDLIIDGYQDVVRMPGQDDMIKKCHFYIMNAIIAGDKDEARRVMQYHLEDIISAVHRVYQEKHDI